MSISVESGEIYGFLGPNGAGKTTTIRTLLDLLHPTSGRALIFGLDSRRASRDIRARLGNLPGDFTCDTRVTGRRFFEFCADARGIRGSARLGCWRSGLRRISIVAAGISLAATARRSG